MKSIVISVATILLLTDAVSAQSQPPRAGVYRIGFIATVSPSRGTRAFRDGLREAGYVEGKNIVIVERFAEGRQDRLPQLVAEVLDLKIDVLVCGSTLTVLAAQKATTTIPIVFASVFDPVGSGIVASLARPGGNITGAALGVIGSGFAGKWLELLKEAVPRISHVAVLWNSANPASAQSLREVQSAARILNVRLDVFDTGNATMLDQAFATIRAGGPHAMIVTNDPFFTASRTKLVEFAASKRLPAVYFFKTFVDAGGLMSYEPSQEESYRRAATLVDKILKGAKPENLPVEQSTRFELAINLRTARALGLTVPSSLLLRADTVIP